MWGVIKDNSFRSNKNKEKEKKKKKKRWRGKPAIIFQHHLLTSVELLHSKEHTVVSLVKNV